MAKKIAVLPLARPTFDVEFAEQTAAAAFAALDACGHEIIGGRDLLFDAEATGDAITAVSEHDPDLVLILQVTFTDATMTIAAADAFSAPLAIWAFPEPRIGGRLRLNALCGLNLAGHALGLNDHPYSYLYAAPDSPDISRALEELFAGSRTAKTVVATAVAGPDTMADKAAVAILDKLSGARIGRIGQHPDGFHTCAFEEADVRRLSGIEVESLPLESLFERARAIPAAAVAETRALAERDLDGLDEVDQAQLDKSLRLKNALDDLRQERGYAAFALRCWPETFTEYGGAVCGPVSMMGEKRVPCACEADVYGAMTSMILQEVADAPAFQVDLVDLDPKDNTGVVWHCGQAPISMADTEGASLATIHTNRKMPLLYEFALKPGRITLARISKARGELKLVLAGAEVQRRPKAFTGTSGVVEFDAPVDDVLDTVMGAALEHHVSLVYGDFKPQLRAVAGKMGLPVLDITGGPRS